MQLTTPFLLQGLLLSLFSLVLYVSQAIGESSTTYLHNPVLFETPLCILVLSVNETQSRLQTSPERGMKYFSPDGCFIFKHQTYLSEDKMLNREI